MALERDLGQSGRMASVDVTDAHKVSTGPWKSVLPKMYYAVTEPGKDDMPGKHLWTNAQQAFYDFHNEIGEQTDVALEHPL